MRIIITGPPGAGKGTMARFIQEDHNIPIISTGEILRKEIKAGTELGKAAKKLIEKGDFVPDEIVVNIIRNFTKDMNNGYLLDGFPRNLPQAIEFEKMLKENTDRIDLVINIDVKDEEIVERVKGRMICSKCSRSYHNKYAKPQDANNCDFCGEKLEKRKDDTEEYIKHRLGIYHQETQPLIDYFAREGILINLENSAADLNDTRKKLKQLLDKKAN